MDPVKIGLAVQGGLSPVCATCKKYWDARERNVPGDTCMARQGCAGPISGGDFHEYEGPITDMSRWCFICAESAKYGVQVTGSPRVVGVCEDHVRKLADLKPMFGNGPDPKFVLKSKNGNQTIREILGLEKKSLRKAMAEAEAHFDKQDGVAEKREEAEYLAKKSEE